MDGKELLMTLVSLTVLVFVLAALRKVIIFFAGKYGVTGIVTFLS